MITAHIKNYKDRSDKSTLLISIPGGRDKTIAIRLAFLSNVQNFDSTKQMLAFVGLNPKPRQSGTSVRGTARISKIGDARLQKSLFMPALSSIRHNPIIKEFAKRLDNAGKAKMTIVIATMRKLLHII